MRILQQKMIVSIPVTTATMTTTTTTSSATTKKIIRRIIHQQQQKVLQSKQRTQQQQLPMMIMTIIIPSIKMIKKKYPLILLLSFVMAIMTSVHAVAETTTTTTISSSSSTSSSSSLLPLSYDTESTSSSSLLSPSSSLSTMLPTTNNKINQNQNHWRNWFSIAGRKYQTTYNQIKKNQQQQSLFHNEQLSKKSSSVYSSTLFSGGEVSDISNDNNNNNDIQIVNNDFNKNGNENNMTDPNDNSVIVETINQEQQLQKNSQMIVTHVLNKIKKTMVTSTAFKQQLLQMVSQYYNNSSESFHYIYKRIIIPIILLMMPISYLWIQIIKSNNNNEPSILSLYSLSLIGSSIGFYIFLYFISVGYATGIGLPILYILWKSIPNYYHYIHSYRIQLQHQITPSSSSSNMGILLSGTSIIQTGMVLLWSIRTFIFLLWREYVNWPALHNRIIKVERNTNGINRRINNNNNNNNNKIYEIIVQNATTNSDTMSTTIDTTNTTTIATELSPTVVQQQRTTITISQKVACWLFYSCMYVCLLSPCWFRYKYDVINTWKVNEIIPHDDTLSDIITTSTAVANTMKQSTTIISLIGIMMQIIGLLIESIADYQKSIFKSYMEISTGTRMVWCGKIGLWKYSTHPNYVGEWIFWLGTHISTLWIVVFDIIICTIQESATMTLRDSSYIIVNAFIKGIIMIIGLSFITSILQNATNKLDIKHIEKYGYNNEYINFRIHYGIFGPKINHQTIMEYWNNVITQMKIQLSPSKKKDNIMDNVNNTTLIIKENDDIVTTDSS